MGWWRFAAVYLLAAFGGSVCVLCFGDRNQAVAGASAAIFGLFAAAWILSNVTGMSTRPFTVVIVINFVFTLSVPGISKLGHVGGFLIGGLATVALLGWTLRASSLRIQTVKTQALGLVAILVVLVGVAVFRTDQLSSSAVSVSATRQLSTGLSTAGENYTDVIPVLSASARP
jgi:hypothetical protein